MHRSARTLRRRHRVRAADAGRYRRRQQCRQDVVATRLWRSDNARFHCHRNVTNAVGRSIVAQNVRRRRDCEFRAWERHNLQTLVLPQVPASQACGIQRSRKNPVATPAPAWARWSPRAQPSVAAAPCSARGPRPTAPASSAHTRARRTMRLPAPQLQVAPGASMKKHEP